MSRTLPHAVVFDCDGTIADTESLSDRAWRATLAEHGYAMTDQDFRAIIGHPFPQNWAYFAARTVLGEQAVFRAALRERFVALFDTELELHEDALETLRSVAEAGVPVAVASSSSHAHVERVLARGGVGGLVPVIVGADDVARHKPLPDPYLAAAAGLDVDPRRCTAVEDTLVGVTSALAAGMFTVAVVRAHGDPDTLGVADRLVHRLDVDALVPDGVGRGVAVVDGPAA